MQTLNIGKDFSEIPAGRFKTDGPYSGEAFREDLLKGKINSLGENEKLIIIIDDGVEGYGSSFLTEGFAGMVKYGYIENVALLEKIEIDFQDKDFEFYKNRIIEYIKKAKFNSENYVEHS